MVRVATWNLENLFRPDSEAGPDTDEQYQAKLASLAGTITTMNPQVLAVQEVGEPEDLEDTEVIMFSALLRGELLRALRRIEADEAVSDQAEQLLGGLHLATALGASPAPTFGTYDSRLAAVTEQAGLATAAPGGP
ncbi:hypothetical protein GCM10027174_10330 [Salinifilum aidingensis]